MVKCAGCGGSFKKSKALKENLDGKDFTFCCRGCRELFWIRKEVVLARTQKFNELYIDFEDLLRIGK